MLKLKFLLKEISLINNLIITNISSSSNIVTTSTTSNNNNIPILSNINNATGNDNETNLDDRYSVVSDSAAWSTDLINNSDSDFESNSPSKYTPYSTYSSNCSSSTHPPLNQSLISELASSNQINSNMNINQQQQNSNLQSSASNYSILVNNSNSSVHFSSTNYSASSAQNINAALNSDTIVNYLVFCNFQSYFC